MNPLLKSLLLSLCGLILTALPIQAEEKSWYEIDGIRIRQGQNINQLVIYMPWYIESQISPFFSGSPQVGAITGIRGEKNLFPLALELPETLMTSWSFRGGLLEFDFPSEVKDLNPGFEHYSSDYNSDGTHLNSQRSSYKTSLYNDFFNTSDKAFADANSNWALGADVTSSRIFLGYTWGFFIPIGEYHRFFKFGAGLGVYYIDLSLKLNLCSQYTVYSYYPDKPEGECVGKTEIDSYSGKKLGVASAAHMNIWEIKTKDSIWRLFKVSEGVALGSNDKGYISVKLKNHSKSLALWMSSLTVEIVSYTYRF